MFLLRVIFEGTTTEFGCNTTESKVLKKPKREQICEVPYVNNNKKK